MSRLTTSSLCVLLAAGCYVRTQAAENPKYRVNVAAKQAGGQIQISVSFFEISPEGTETKLSSPVVVINDGQQANLLTVRGTEAQQSGLQVQIIKAKGNPEVLVVSSVLEKGSILWAEAKTVKVEKGPLAVAKKAGGATSRPAASSPEEIPARRLQLEMKIRHPAGRGDWGQRGARMVAIAPVPLELREPNAPGGVAVDRPGEAACEFTPFGKGGQATIKGLKGWLLPADPADFEAGTIRASENEFRSRGRAPYPVANGKVFAIRYEDQSGVGEALVRIVSISTSNDLGPDQ